MSLNVIVVTAVIVNAIIHEGCTASTIDEDASESKNVLTRLSNVEKIVKVLQEENRKLRLENHQLLDRVDKVETACHARHFQFMYLRRKLKQAEKEIINLIRKNGTAIGNKHAFGSKHDHDKSEFKQNNCKFKSLTKMKQCRQNATMKKTVGKSILVDAEEPSRRSKRLLLADSTPPTIVKRPRIAFSSHTNANQRNLGTGQKLLFDVINDNEGGAYDNQSGIFIAPVAGTYHFEATITSFNSERVDTQIVVNGNVKASLVSAGHSGQVAQSSNSLNIHLNHGAHVWVQKASVGSNVAGNKYSHFGGFILWQD